MWSYGGVTYDALLTCVHVLEISPKVYRRLKLTVRTEGLLLKLGFSKINNAFLIVGWRQRSIILSVRSKGSKGKGKGERKETRKGNGNWSFGRDGKKSRMGCRWRSGRASAAFAAGTRFGSRLGRLQFSSVSAKASLPISLSPFLFLSFRPYAWSVPFRNSLTCSRRQWEHYFDSWHKQFDFTKVCDWALTHATNYTVSSCSACRTSCVVLTKAGRRLCWNWTGRPRKLAAVLVRQNWKNVAIIISKMNVKAL